MIKMTEIAENVWKQTQSYFVKKNDNIEYLNKPIHKFMYTNDVGEISKWEFIAFDLLIPVQSIF